MGRPKYAGPLTLTRLLPCTICSKMPPSDAHHFRSKGAGGQDVLNNLVSLCREHHQEFHTIGVETWLKKYQSRVIGFRKVYGLPPLMMKNGDTLS